MKISSWGNYKSVDAEIISPRTYSELKSFITQKQPFIPRGEGKSYGDSALANTVIRSEGLNHFLDFDTDRGILRCQSGVTLEMILEAFVPRGWFLYSTPGTKLISVGGAVASDVHGKSHHKEGTFGEHIYSLKLMLPDGNILECSNDKNADLFRATCGGMGLTGFILEVTLQLKPISSSYLQTIVKSGYGLKNTMQLFHEFRDADYSVAWLDCINRTAENLVSIFSAGHFQEKGSLDKHQQQKLSVPGIFPSFLLNRYSAALFNRLYYWKNRFSSSQKSEHYDSFFYPLDSVANWNRVYGKSGFTQYQFVVPHDSSFEVLSEIINRIHKSDFNSYLAVLKEFGKQNDHFLSFPMEGFSLAVDFKIKEGIFDFLSELDEIVINNGGRIYLTKDAHISKRTFKKGYPEYQQFLDVLDRYNISGQTESLQSKRIGISR